MNIPKYIKKEENNNELSKQLIAELKKFSTDEEFIFGVLYQVENDEDKLTLLKYIYKGEDVNYEQIILNALWLCKQRYGEDAE